MTKLECGLFLSVLALAAVNSTVLCSSGKKFKLLDQGFQQFWLQWPQIRDFDGAYHRRTSFRSLDYVPDFSQEQVKLDFFVFGNDTTVYKASKLLIA